LRGPSEWGHCAVSGVIQGGARSLMGTWRPRRVRPRLSELDCISSWKPRLNVQAAEHGVREVGLTYGGDDTARSAGDARRPLRDRALMDRGGPASRLRTWAAHSVAIARQTCKTYGIGHRAGSHGERGRMGGGALSKLCVRAPNRGCARRRRMGREAGGGPRRVERPPMGMRCRDEQNRAVIRNALGLSVPAACWPSPCVVRAVAVAVHPRRRLRVRGQDHATPHGARVR
jgi:hypothetical protein